MKVKKYGFLLKFKAEVVGGRLFPRRIESEAIEREILKACEEGEVVKVLVFRIGPDVGPWSKKVAS